MKTAGCVHVGVVVGRTPCRGSCQIFGPLEAKDEARLTAAVHESDHEGEVSIGMSVIRGDCLPLVMILWCVRFREGCVRQCCDFAPHKNATWLLPVLRLAVFSPRASGSSKVNNTFIWSCRYLNREECEKTALPDAVAMDTRLGVSAPGRSRHASGSHYHASVFATV